MRGWQTPRGGSQPEFGQPETRLGLIPGWGGTQRLTRLVGPGRAKELIYTGRLLDAAEALRLGLVHAVWPADRLLSATRDLAARLADQAPLALAAAKQAIDAGADHPLAAGNQIEIALFERVFGSADCREGLEAFVAKRAPRFTGT